MNEHAKELLNKKIMSMRKLTEEEYEKIRNNTELLSELMIEELIMEITLNNYSASLKSYPVNDIIESRIREAKIQMKHVIIGEEFLFDSGYLNKILTEFGIEYSEEKKSKVIIHNISINKHNIRELNTKLNESNPKVRTR